ncbi:unnamed protein product [Acanthocheilonema viteae]|uniref:Uncharacterized protein n=1 Tax=Acanthocheilonema viteae TaxID=6277 RepID=A0A498SFJ2_ACAVI|nr:unnamed protein product [Acanthocheilonema viteae]
MCPSNILYPNSQHFTQLYEPVESARQYDMRSSFLHEYMAFYLLSRGVQKRAFFALNTIFWVLGLGSLLIGLWSYVTKQTYVDLIPSSYGTLSAVGLCIAAGLTVIIITFVGCLGVWVESRLLLFAYIFFVFLLLAVQFVVSILALNYQSDIYGHVRSDMEQSLKYHREVFTNSQLTWDKLQEVFLCCGVNGPADWFDNQKWSNSSYVPDSCCNKIYLNPNSSMKNCGKDKENWDLWVAVKFILIGSLKKLRLRLTLLWSSFALKTFKIFIFNNIDIIKSNLVVPFGTGISHISIGSRNPDVIQLRQLYVSILERS